MHALQQLLSFYELALKHLPHDDPMHAKMLTAAVNVMDEALLGNVSLTSTWDLLSRLSKLVPDDAKKLGEDVAFSGGKKVKKGGAFLNAVLGTMKSRFDAVQDDDLSCGKFMELQVFYRACMTWTTSVP